VKLNFVRKGRGRPLVALHGLFGSSNNWAPLAAALEASFDLILPDLRNHGRSPHAAEASLESMSADVLELMDALDLGRVFLLGHSLGGRVAMRLALDFPGRVERLLVADMGPKEIAPLYPEIFEALAGLNLGALSSRAQADALLKQALPDPALRAFLLTNLSRDEGGKFAWKMNLEALKAAGENLRSQIKAPAPFRGPALFLRGENSNYVGESDLKGIQLLFPAARIETLAGAGHWLHADQPKKFAAAVSAFFGVSGAV
jgi:esterase